VRKLLKTSVKKDLNSSIKFVNVIILAKKSVIL